MRLRLKKPQGKAFLAAAALLLALSITLSSCASQGATKRGDGQSESRMFWTLESQAAGAGKGTLYVQGTLHLGRSELYPLDTLSLSKMAGSDVILAELSQSELEAAQLLMLDRLAESILPDGTTLMTLLPADELDWIRSFMGADTVETFARYEPWVIMSALEMFAASRVGLDSALGVDASLFKEASRLNKKVEGLETAEFQINILTGQALSDQVLILRDSIRECRDQPKGILKLYEAYRDDKRQQLANEITASVSRSEAAYPTLKDYNESLLDSRNIAWARRLHGLLDSGLDVYLFAGAAHFVGDGNVLERLEAYGYKAIP